MPGGATDGESDPGALRPGDRFGPHEIVRLLGRGPGTAVYEARVGEPPCASALKIIHGDWAGRPRFRRAFRRETRRFRRRLPGVVELRDAGEHEGSLWMRCDLADGVDLGPLDATGRARDLGELAAATGGRLEQRLLAVLLRRALRVLDSLHRARLCHLDLKPSNLLLDAPRGAVRVRLGDVVMGRLRRSGAGGVTPAEGAAADLQALGLMARRLLTGQGDTDGPVSQFDVQLVPVWDDILHRAMAADPAARFRSAEAMRAMLERVLVATDPPERRTWQTVPVLAPPPVVFSLDDLKALRQRAEEAWERARAGRGGPGLDALLASAQGAARSAVEACDGRRRIEARSRWEALLTTCKAVERASRDRVEALRGRAETVRARQAAQRRRAEERAEQAWRDAEGRRSAAEQAFRSGAFLSARDEWRGAARLYLSAANHAVGVARVERARRKFEAALRDLGPRRLAEYGGERWERVADLVAETASRDSPPDRAVRLYQAARGLLPEAASAADRQRRQRRCDELVAQARAALPDARRGGAPEPWVEVRRLARAALATEAPELTQARTLLAQASRRLPPRGWAWGRRLTRVAEGGAEEERRLMVYTSRLGVAFARVLPGEFCMGDTLSPREARRIFTRRQRATPSNALPPRRARITRPFYISAAPVTRGLFARFVREAGHVTEAERPGPDVNWRGPGYPQGDDHPVVCVTWRDARAFCRWLGEREGAACRLPTEGEWEYAARAGSPEPWFWGRRPEGAQGRANLGSASTAPVGAGAANAWGLVDAIGNVWEWCEDVFAAGYPSVSRLKDPPGPVHGFDRVLRGGSWDDGPARARTAVRLHAPPDTVDARFGFRVAVPAAWTRVTGLV